MGGNAFKQLLPNVSFKRMSPNVYHTLKTALRTQLLTCYEVVETPIEAPEKADFGDIDFQVAHPSPTLNDVVLREKLQASSSIVQPGFRTSNFAVPLHAFFPDQQTSIDGSTSSDVVDTGEYCQVDVHLCASKDELEANLFFQSYGDLLQILGVIAYSVGLSFGSTGLKLSDPLPTSPPISFYLSTSLMHILEYYGLTMDRWKRGFETQRELFDWTTSSRLFDPRRIRTYDEVQTSKAKQRKDRTVYQNFLAYVREQAQQQAQAGVAKKPHIGVEDALRFFGKEDEYNAILRADSIRRRAKETFNGHIIRNITGLVGMPVKLVSDAVKQKLAEERKSTDKAMLPTVALQGYPMASVLDVAIAERSEDSIRSVIMQVKEEMQAAGQLNVDWRAAKARKEQKKKEAIPATDEAA